MDLRRVDSVRFAPTRLLSYSSQNFPKKRTGIICGAIVVLNLLNKREAGGHQIICNVTSDIWGIRGRRSKVFHIVRSNCELAACPI